MTRASVKQNDLLSPKCLGEYCDANKKERGAEFEDQSGVANSRFRENKESLFAHTGVRYASLGRHTEICLQ